MAHTAGRSALTALILLVATHPAQAAALGIALDSFISQFQLFVVGLGLVSATVGLVGWIGSLFDNPFSNILAGSISFFTKAGLLGGGTTILGALGLVGGATL